MALSGRTLDQRIVKGIQSLRRKGLTVREVAERLGVSRPTVRKYGAFSVSSASRLPIEQVRLIEGLAQAGFSARDIARQLGIREKTALRYAKAYMPAKRSRKTATAEELQAARREGFRAAMDALPEADCPYSQGQVGLRCAWMAAYHDNQDLLA